MDCKMIQQKLVHILLQRMGFETINYTSIRQVSQQLRPRFKISENTLARMVGLRNDGRTHYRHTMDEVAKAAGFVSFQRYEQVMQASSNIKFNVAHHPDAAFFTSYAGVAAKENEIRYLEHLVSFIDKNGISVSEHFSLGEHILQGIRQNKQPKKVIDCLVSNPTLVDLYLKWWVDIDYLDKYYGKAMQALSKSKELPIADYLFANTIAFEYEWRNKMEKQSLRRASLLSEMGLTDIIQLIEQHDIFPAARLVKVTLMYHHQSGKQDKKQDLLDFTLSMMETLSADEAIIFISQLSELGFRLPIAFRKRIEHKFTAIKDKVNHEWDSLVNAGLNLQRMSRQKKLISANQVKQILETHPRQVMCNQNRFLQKLKHLKD
jgi:hypothetical protein